MIEYLIDILISLIGSFSVYIFLQYIGFRNGMRSLLKNEIIRVYEKYISLGYCPSYVKENIKDVYDSYHKLKGNGMCTSMVNDLYKLPNELRRENER